MNLKARKPSLNSKTAALQAELVEWYSLVFSGKTTMISRLFVMGGEMEEQLELFSLEFHAFLAQRFPGLSGVPADDALEAVYADTCNVMTVAYSPVTDIYLRCPRTSAGELVISRLHFRKREDCRHGTAIMAFLAEKAELYGISRLRIEDANQRADAFASKLGFTLDVVASDCKHDNDWIIDTPELQAHLR